MKCALVALGRAHSTGCADSASASPSILLITLDTMHADYLGTYGYEGGKAPDFDALAAVGVRFDMAISASAVGMRRS